MKFTYLPLLVSLPLSMIVGIGGYWWARRQTPEARPAVARPAVAVKSPGRRGHSAGAALPLAARPALEEALSLDTGTALRALVAFLPDATAEELRELASRAKALEDAGTLTLPPYGWWRTLFFTWARVDAAAAEAFSAGGSYWPMYFKEGLAEARPDENNPELSSISKLLLTDPAAAAAMARKWAKNAENVRSGISSIFRSLANQDLGLAMALLNEEPSPTLRREGLAGMFGALPNDPESRRRFVAIFANLSQADQSAALASEWGDENRPGLMELAEVARSPELKARLRLREFSRKLQTDPASASEWLPKLSSEERAKTLKASLGRVQSETGLAQLAKYFTDGVLQPSEAQYIIVLDKLLPRLSSGLALRVASEMLIQKGWLDGANQRVLAEKLLATDRSRALQLMSAALPEDGNASFSNEFFAAAAQQGVRVGDLKNPSTKVLTGLWRGSGPEQRAEIADYLARMDAGSRKTAADQLFQGMDFQNLPPAEAVRARWQAAEGLGQVLDVDWPKLGRELTALPEQEIVSLTGRLPADQLAKAAPGLMETWLKQDAEAASVWANALPPGPVRGAAALGVVLHLGQKPGAPAADATAALHWLREIDPADQSQAAAAIQKLVRQYDSPEIRQQAASLPSHILNTLWP